MSQRQLFSSPLATILTMIGVSVGLGNVWRFPYMMGQYGGSAFLVVYLFFTFAFAVPAVMAEWALGRATRRGPVGAFSAAFGKSWGRAIGFLLLFTVLTANSYYIVVIANVAFSAWFAISNGFSETTIPAFSQQLGQGSLQYAIALAILFGSLFVIYRGLNSGIEKVSRLFVPFFLVVMGALVAFAFSLEGAVQEFVAFLKPDFSALGPAEIFAALGQTFFSLGLGGTFLLIYGSYLRDDANIPRSAIWVASGDVGAALLASFFIAPAVLALGLNMASGPGLIFSTLPNLFAQIPAGRMLGAFFLLALCAVALLSNIAALEVLVGSVKDDLTPKLSRAKIILIIGVLEIIFILPSAFNPNLIGVLDMIFGSGMQVFGGALAVLAITWGLGKSVMLNQVFGLEVGGLQRLLFHWLRWAVPGVLLVILASYIYTTLFG